MQKSTVGGILSIVAGALGLVGGLLTLLFGLFFATMADSQGLFTDGTVNADQMVTIFAVIYCIFGAFSLVTGVLAITGGVFSIQRKHWGWALAGAVGGCMTFLPLGIGAVVLVAMGRPEFNSSPPVVPLQPLSLNPV